METRLGPLRVYVLKYITINKIPLLVKIKKERRNIIILRSKDSLTKTKLTQNKFFNEIFVKISRSKI